MIQRKQTLFLLQLVLFSVAMLLIPHQIIFSKVKNINVYLFPLVDFTSTMGHYAAIAINLVGLIVTIATIFLYKKRALQVKLCYILMFIWLVICAMIAFCPFVNKTDAIIEIKTNYFGYLCSAFAVLAAYMAIIFIKKDIELLKSADRIR
jgi:hypothetical protein